MSNIILSIINVVSRILEALGVELRDIHPRLNENEVERSKDKDDSFELEESSEVFKAEKGVIKYFQPLEGNNQITSYYGWRVLPTGRNYHVGLDLVGLNTNLHNIEKCKVTVIVRPDYKYPTKHVWVRGKGWVLRKLPNKKRAWTPRVEMVSVTGERKYIFKHVDPKKFLVVGSILNGDSVFGNYGNWGFSFGGHLHIEVYERVSDVWKRKNPHSYLKKLGLEFKDKRN